MTKDDPLGKCEFDQTEKGYFCNAPATQRILHTTFPTPDNVPVHYVYELCDKHVNESHLNWVAKWAKLRPDLNLLEFRKDVKEK